MTKTRIQFINGAALFFGPMTSEAIRSRVEAFEAFTGSYPRILVRAPTVSKRAVMVGPLVAFTVARPVISLHRLFIKVKLDNRVLDLIPEQVPDLVVELHLDH